MSLPQFTIMTFSQTNNKSSATEPTAPDRNVAVGSDGEYGDIHMSTTASQ